MSRTAEHPSRRRVDGFAGLRLVSGPHDVESEADERLPFTVQVLVAGDGTVSIEWDPKTPDAVRLLHDVRNVIGAACYALRSDQDVDGRIQAAYDHERTWREHAEAKYQQWLDEHPWECGCGKRCKTAGGLTNHRRAGGPRCG